jgi:hypothetical protein
MRIASHIFATICRQLREPPGECGSAADRLRRVQMLQKIYTQIPLKEICKISFTCRECKTEILVDINENADRGEDEVQELGKVCPICGQNFEAIFSQIFDQFVYWFKSAARSDHDFSFFMDHL